MIRSMLLALLGGVRMSDAVEACSYERIDPPGRREDLLTPTALAIIERTDVVVELGRQVAVERRRQR